MHAWQLVTLIDWDEGYPSLLLFFFFPANS